MGRHYQNTVIYTVYEEFTLRALDGEGKRAEKRAGGEGGSGMDCQFGINRCRLLHLEWINNEVLLYRELYPITCDRLRWKIMCKEECVYMYDWVTLLYAEIDRTL